MKWISVDEVTPPLHKWIYMTRDKDDPECTSNQRLGGYLKTPADVDKYCKEIGYTYWADDPDHPNDPVYADLT